MTIKLVHNKGSKSRAMIDLKKQSAAQKLENTKKTKELNIPKDIDIALIIGDGKDGLVILDRKGMTTPELYLFLELIQKQLIEEFEEVLDFLQEK